MTLSFVPILWISGLLHSISTGPLKSWPRSQIQDLDASIHQVSGLFQSALTQFIFGWPGHEILWAITSAWCPLVHPFEAQLSRSFQCPDLPERWATKGVEWKSAVWTGTTFPAHSSRKFRRCCISVPDAQCSNSRTTLPCEMVPTTTIFRRLRATWFRLIWGSQKVTFVDSSHLEKRSYEEKLKELDMFN